MSKSPQEYYAENAHIPAEAGFFGYQGGKIRREPRRIEEFTPDSRIPIPPAEQMSIDIAANEHRFYGVPLSHADQQNQARTYGWASMGFDDTPVIFRVNWAYQEPSDFMVDEKDEGRWRQLHTVDTSPAEAIVYRPGEKVRNWE